MSSFDFWLSDHCVIYDIMYFHLSSQEQYDYCYRVVQDFVDIYSDYANFKWVQLINTHLLLKKEKKNWRKTLLLLWISDTPCTWHFLFLLFICS